MGGFAGGAALGEGCHSRADIIRADVVGIEGTPVPLEHGFVFGMARLGHGVDKLLEPRWAADILGRCAALAIDEAGIISGRIGGQDCFDHDAVPPVIAKIIGVGEVRDAAFDELCEAQIAGVAGWRVHVIVVEADAVAGLADIEAEQVVVLKQHDGLDREVQRLEAVGEGQLDPSPDGRIDVVECDANPRDLVSHAAMLIGARSAVQFHGMSSSQREAGQSLAILAMTSAI